MFANVATAITSGTVSHSLVALVRVAQVTSGIQSLFRFEMKN